MPSLNSLLAQYLAAESRPACELPRDGVYTFDIGDGILLCVLQHEDGSLEFFASPGYFAAGQEPPRPAHQVQDAIAEDGDDDILERWYSHGVLWSIDLDPSTGLLTVAGVPLEPPWDVAGFASAVEAFREIYLVWEERLQSAPDPWRTNPGTDAEAFAHAPFLRA